MHPELEIQTHAEPKQGHYWTILFGSDVICQSPVGKFWEDADVARANAESVVAQIAFHAASDQPGALAGGEGETFAITLARELVRRSVLPTGFLKLHGIED